MAGLLDLYEKWDEGKLSDEELQAGSKALGFGPGVIVRNPPQPQPVPTQPSGAGIKQPAFT